MSSRKDRDKRAVRKSWVSKRARQERQGLVLDAKGDRCLDCGQTFNPVCLDLHHVDPSQKVATIGWMVRYATLEGLKAELSKVIPVCANCHRLRTVFGPPGE